MLTQPHDEVQPLWRGLQGPSQHSPSLLAFLSLGAHWGFRCVPWHLPWSLPTRPQPSGGGRPTDILTIQLPALVGGRCHQRLPQRGLGQRPQRPMSPVLMAPCGDTEESLSRWGEPGRRPEPSLPPPPSPPFSLSAPSFSRGAENPLSISHALPSSRRRQWHPLQSSCLENLMDGGAWWAAVHGVAKSQT